MNHMLLSLPMLLTIGVTVLGSVDASFAQNACELQKLVASDGESSEHFGLSVAMDGDIAVIGAPWDDDACPEIPTCYSGSAYVFRFDGSTWVEEQKLLPKDGAYNDWFGFSTGISGDTIIVGMFFDDDNGSSSGSAYIFRYNGSVWVQTQKLLPSDGAQNDMFGRSVAIDGDRAVIGASHEINSDESPGYAYVFRFDGSSWIEEQKLASTDGAVGDFFGMSVSISGDAVLIGAERDDDLGFNSGSAYVFRFDPDTSQWVQEHKLLPSDGTAYDVFGGLMGVAIDGDTALVGARIHTHNAPVEGAAYVFRHIGGGFWVEEQELLASDPCPDQLDDWFGYSVALSGDAAVVGSPFHCENGDSSGAAYLFRFDGVNWIEEQEFLPAEIDSYDRFGQQVAISGDIAMIGAAKAVGTVYNAGAVYSFAGLSAIDCNSNEVSDACDILAGTSPDANGNGIPDECEGPACGDCPTDVNGDGSTGPFDLAFLLGNWGPCIPGDDCECLDANDDRTVGPFDLAVLLGAWGPCE